MYVVQTVLCTDGSASCYTDSALCILMGVHDVVQIMYCVQMLVHDVIQILHCVLMGVHDVVQSVIIFIVTRCNYCSLCNPQ